MIGRRERQVYILRLNEFFAFNLTLFEAVNVELCTVRTFDLRFRILYFRLLTNLKKYAET